MAEKDNNPYRPKGWSSVLEANTRVTDDGAAPPRAVPERTSLRSFDQLGTYQLLRRLGGGGMAEVFLARSALGEGVEKLVAFKTARPQYGPDTRLGALFLNEARVSASFAHPNIIQVFGFGEAAGRPYIAMEFLRGRDLLQLVMRLAPERRPVPVAIAVAIAVDVCRALEYVHDQRGPDGRALNLVHRDVTPGNILVSELGEVKLMDFGVAAAEGLAQDGLVVGKAAYSPPEQQQGREPSPQWDVFALGVTLRELLTLDHGPLPRPRASLLNREVTAELDGIIEGATHPDPNFRCPSASALRSSLERVLQRMNAQPDLGKYIVEVFGPDLRLEEYEDGQLLVRGREQSPTQSVGLLHPLTRPFVAVRRRVVSSRFYMDNRRGLLAAVAVACLASLAAAGLAVRDRQLSQRMDSTLAAVDGAIAKGQWVGTGPDTALAHLSALDALSPNDPRAAARRKKLAAKLEALGALALSRKDEAEALVHFEAAVAADPLAEGALRQLRLIEDKARAMARSRATRGDAP